MHSPQGRAEARAPGWGWGVERVVWRWAPRRWRALNDKGEGYWLPELFLLRPSPLPYGIWGACVRGVTRGRLLHPHTCILCSCSTALQRGLCPSSSTAFLGQDRGLPVPAKVWAPYPSSRVTPGPTMTTESRGSLRRGTQEGAAWAT